MSSFLKTLLLFSLPFLGFALYLLQAPYSKAFGYSYRKNVDCNTSWIYYRLFENQTPVDVAFLGTSHTGCGINDSLITNTLNNKFGQQLKVSNLAYCTKGRNIQHSILKDLLQTKKPKLILIEIMAEESTGGHQDYPYISPMSDILRSFAWQNTHYPEDVLTALEARFHYFRKGVSRTIAIPPPTNAESNYSYTPFKFRVEPAVLEKHQEKKVKRLKKGLSAMNRFKQQHSNDYLVEMAALAKAQRAKLVFLYLPSYGTGLKKSKQHDFYSSLGEVWLPPAALFTNTQHWVDGEHLNYWGATALGNWLAQQIAEQL
jgi:hypothetical protein